MHTKSRPKYVHVTCLHMPYWRSREHAMSAGCALPNTATKHSAGSHLEFVQVHPRGWKLLLVGILRAWKRAGLAYKTGAGKTHAGADAYRQRPLRQPGLAHRVFRLLLVVAIPVELEVAAVRRLCSKGPCRCPLRPPGRGSCCRHDAASRKQRHTQWISCSIFNFVLFRQALHSWRRRCFL